MLTKLCPSSCLVLLVLACAGHEPARSAERASSPGAITPPASSSLPDGEASSSSTAAASTELTPASGALPASTHNALALNETGEREATAPEPPAEPARTPDVVYVPTPQPVVDRMLQMAEVKKNDIVYDLGCGDGRIVVTAAKRYGTRAYGFDIDPDRVAEARANVKAAKVEHLVTIEQKDIFTLDLSPASVVTLYLLPKLNVRLIPQLEKLKPGSRIVSHDFDMEGVKPLKHVTLRPAGEADDHHIYLWKTPLVREQSGGS
jgi:SAM-dependent methyltransferase